MGNRVTAAYIREVRHLVSRKNHGINEQAGVPPERHAARREIQRLNELRQAGVLNIKARGGSVSSADDLARRLNGDGK